MMLHKFLINLYFLEIVIPHISPETGLLNKYDRLTTFTKYHTKKFSQKHYQAVIDASIKQSVI